MRHEQELLAGDLSFGPKYKACLFCPANPGGRGAKSLQVTCDSAIRTSRSWSKTDQALLAEKANDSVRTSPREDDPL